MAGPASVAPSEYSSISSPAEEIDRLPPQLESRKEEFQPFFESLREEQKARRTLDFQRIEDVKLFLQQLQQRLMEEGNERRFADACLDRLLQTRLDVLQQHLIHKFQVGLAKLHADLDLAKSRLGDTEKRLQEAREKSRREVAELRMDLNRQLDEMQSDIRAAAAERRKQDEQTRKALEKEVKDVTKSHESLSLCRKDIFDILSKRVDDLERPGEPKAGQIAIDLLFKRLDELNEELQVEKSERCEEEEQMADVLQQFAVKLEEGLRIVNKS